jgi:hypothetical protein
VRRSLLLLGLALAGCGSTSSAQLPPAAASRSAGEPPRRVDACRDSVDSTSYDSGHLIAVLCGRERVVQLFDAKTRERIAVAPAGTGPARIASDGQAVLYVTDLVADALLVYHLHPRFELIRRVNLPGGPTEIAHDRSVLRITLTRLNRVVEYADGSRPVPCTRSPRC